MSVSLVKAGKVDGSGGQPLSSSSSTLSVPSILLAMSFPAETSNGSSDKIKGEGYDVFFLSQNF